MRVVITGASGNVGSAPVRRLGGEWEVDALVGPCRRAPSWRPPKTTRLLPASPHLFDLVARIPMLDATRARQELGWEPRHDALAAVRAFLEGLWSGEGGPTPPLAPETGGRRRHRGHEVATGVGVRP